MKWTNKNKLNINHNRINKEGIKMNQLYSEKYVKDEKCDWLVFLHGFGGSTKMWKRQIDSFKEKFNLLILDLPGHGKSSEGIANKGFNKFEEVAEMVIDVLKENKIEIATFVCVSLGTLVFAGIFDKYPEMVKGAVLCGAVMGMHKGWVGILKICDKIRYCFPYMFLMNVFSGILLPLKAHQKSRKFFLKSGKLLGRKEFMAWFDLFVKDMNALRDLKTLSDLKENLLFITGNEDFRFIKGVKKALNNLKCCHLKILNKCGHVCNIQKWQEFNEVSLKFIENLS